MIWHTCHLLRSLAEEQRLTASSDIDVTMATKSEPLLLSENC